MNEPLDDFRNLKTWLTRACQNAEDETKGRLPIRSEIRAIFKSIARMIARTNFHSHRIWKALVRGAEQEGKIGSRTVGQRKGEVLIPGRSRMTRECHVRFLREGCDTTTYQARRAVHGAASLLTWSMHIALSRRLAPILDLPISKKIPGSICSLVPFSSFFVIQRQKVDVRHYSGWILQLLQMNPHPLILDISLGMQSILFDLVPYVDSWKSKVELDGLSRSALLQPRSSSA
ncbi:UNVERIFIED_CONTAM: hypothetical protein Sradi_7135600 [Sesamum radiatum]|uniref:Uncharacterized protein n=1 Tax=Sesamum radiatum TaxID=300843 RepID=A0AAW2IZQ6_SESRA